VVSARRAPSAKLYSAGPTLVGMAFDGHIIAAILLQPARLFGEGSLRGLVQVTGIAVEEYPVTNIDGEILRAPGCCWGAPLRPASEALSAGVLAQAEIARARRARAANFHSPVRWRKLIPHSFCDPVIAWQALKPYLPLVKGMFHQP